MTPEIIKAHSDFDNLKKITPVSHAIFQDHGCKVLYDVLMAKDIQKKRALKKSQQILDSMGITVFFANLIRATQTEEELKKGKIYGRAKVNKAHYKVGKKVRRTSQELGGAMLEASQEERSIKSLVTKSDAQD